MRSPILLLTLLVLFRASYAQPSDSHPLTGIVYDGNYIWCPVGLHNVGIVRWDPVSEDYILYSAPEPLVKNNVTKIVTDGEGKIWLRYYQSAEITEFDGTTWKNYQFDTNVNAIAVDGDGVLLACTNNGLFCLADTGWVDLSQEYGFSDSVFDLQVDGLGNLIICEGISSLNFHNPTRFWRRKDGDLKLIHQYAYYPSLSSVIASQVNGDLWRIDSSSNVIGNESFHYLSYSDSIWQNCPLPELPEMLYTEGGLFFDEEGSPWIKVRNRNKTGTVVTFYYIYVSFKDYTATIYTPEEAPPYLFYDWVYDNNDIKWIATEDGLVRYDGTSYRTLTNVVEDPKPLPLELKAYPNPFNNEITVLVNLDTGAFTELSIYSINGQKICTLSETTLSAGQHSFKWDGRDDRGGTVSSGIYLIRMNTGANGITRKVVFLK